MALPTSHSASIRAVQRYYEQNTRLFRAAGLGNRSYAVHRALWDASVTTFDAALQRVNALVLEEVQAFLEASHPVRLHLIDLGCGVGGTLAYCARAAGGADGRRDPEYDAGADCAADSAARARQ